VTVVDEPRWHLEPFDEATDLPPDDHHHQPDTDPPDLPLVAEDRRPKDRGR
jgi:hypothetical protein